MSDFTLEVLPRERTGSAESRRLRAAGRLPAVVYGLGGDPVPIQLDRAALHGLLKQEGGANAVFLLKLGGTDKKRHAMVRELDLDPITRQVRHVDFQRINLKDKVRVDVPIEILGEPTGVKNESGVLDFVTREIEVECLPTAIPAKIEVDVSALHVGQHIEAGELQIPEGVEMITERDRVLVSVSHSRVAEAVLEAEEAEEAVELIEAEREEPELIGRKEAEDEPAAES